MLSTLQKTGAAVLVALLAQQAPPLRAGNGPSRTAVKGALVLGLLAGSKVVATVPAAPAQAGSRVEGMVRLPDLGISAEAAPGLSALLEQLAEAYPGELCSGRPPKDQWQFASHCRLENRTDAVMPTEEEAALAAEAMGCEDTAEEYRIGAQRAVQDLALCVCLARQEHAASYRADRDRMLLEQLRASKAERQDLAVAIRTYELIRAQLFKAMAADPKLWAEPADAEYRPEWPHGVPHPLRVDILNGGIEQMSKAKDCYDETVLPLLVELKKRDNERLRWEKEERRESRSSRKSRRAGKT